MPLFIHDLRWHVLFGTAHGKSSSFPAILCFKQVSLEFFAQAKVCQFYVPVTSDKNIFRLQIPVQHILGVQIIQSQNYLGRIKHDGFLVKTISLRQLEE